MMKSRKGDLFDVTTLGRGIKISDACPQLEFKGKGTATPAPQTVPEEFSVFGIRFSKREAQACL